MMPEDYFKSLLRPRIREPLPKPLVGASQAQLSRALIDNHRAWRTRLARAAKGVVHTQSGFDWMHAPDVATGLAITGIAESEVDAQLSEAFAYFGRKRNPIPVTVTAGDSSGPSDLVGRLVAWGVRPMFQPGLAVDFKYLNAAMDLPRDVTVSLVEDLADLPESGHTSKAVAARLRAQTMRPKRVWHLVARYKRKPVGQMTVHIGAGVAGFYDLMVCDQARGQGMGSALMMGACLFAKKLGYRYGVLTAFQTGLFRRVGFGKVCRMLVCTPLSDDLRGRPSEGDLDIACAASTGERGRFCRLLRQYPKAMTWQSRTGVSLMHVAVASGRPDFACWLLDRGAKVDAETALKLGLK